MRYKEFVAQQHGPDKEVQRFALWVADQLGLERMPAIHLDGEKQHADDHHTGSYDPNNGVMRVYTGRRNLIDILRTVAHELVHRVQDEQDRIENTYPGHPLEQEADAAAGYLVKIYGEQHPEIMQ
jgi:Zn-dependent peptidase ImmA (M78 family)